NLLQFSDRNRDRYRTHYRTTTPRGSPDSAPVVERLMKRLVQPRQRNGKRPRRLRRRSIPLTMCDGRKSLEPQCGHAPADSIGFLNHEDTGSEASKYQNITANTRVDNAYASARF